MTIEQIPVDFESGRGDWLKLRERDVTASDVATLLSVDANPYKTPRRLWEIKSGRLRERVKDNRALMRGRLMEPIVTKLIASDFPEWRVEPCGFYFRDPEARLGATPDAFIWRPDRPGRGNCQIKTAGAWAFRKNWIVEAEDGDEPELDDDGEVVRPIIPPAWIMAQAILEAHLAGCEWTCVAVVEMDAGLDLRIVDVPKDERVIANMYAKAREFWRSIEASEPPPYDFMRDGDLLSAMHPSETYPLLDDLTGNTSAGLALDEYRRACIDLKDATERKTVATNKLRAIIGDGSGFTYDKRARVTWTAQLKARGAHGAGRMSRVLRVTDRRPEAVVTLPAAAPAQSEGAQDDFVQF